MKNSEGTDGGQGYFPMDREPLLREDGVYSRPQILNNLRISSETFMEWEEDEALKCQPGTKDSYYYGADVIAYMRKHRQKRPPRRK